MGYILLWIEVVILLSLLAALGIAITARLKSTILRNLLMALWLLATIAILCLPTIGIAVLVYSSKLAVYTKWFAYTLSYGIVALMIICILTRRGLQQKEDHPAAAHWSAKWIAVSFLVALWLHIFTLGSMDASMQNKLSQLRAESTALALSVAPQRVPDNENSALWYKRLAYALPDRKDQPKEYDKWCDWLDEKQAEFNPSDQKLRDYLQSNHSAIALIHRATEMPGCCFERNYAQLSIATLLPEYSWVRDGFLLLALDARIHAADENVDGAFRDVKAMHQMANHIKTEPFLIGVLIAISVDARAVKSLEYVLATTDFQEKHLLDLPLEDPLRYSDGMARAMKAEEAFGLSIFSSFGVDMDISLTDIFGEGSNIPSPLLAYWRIFFMPDDIRSYKKVMGEMQNYGLEPYHQNAKKRKEMDHKDFRKEAGIFTSMLVPAIFICYERAAEGDAQRGLAQLAVACERYKLASGEYPRTIDELMPDFLPIVPYDPFDGKPLKMVEANGGLVLYSIGPDEVDDGGREMDNEKKGDITFCLGDAFAARRLKKSEKTDEPKEGDRER